MVPCVAFSLSKVDGFSRLDHPFSKGNFDAERGCDPRFKYSNSRFMIIHDLRAISWHRPRTCSGLRGAVPSRCSAT